MSWRARISRWTRDGVPGAGGGSRGFTIIELMVAITLLSIITAIVFASFDSVVRTSDVARLAAARLRLRGFMTRSLSVNVSQAYGGWLPGAALRDAVFVADDGGLPEDDLMAEDELLTVRYVFQGVNDVGAEGLPADMLSFTSTAPLIGNLALPGLLKQVTYEIVSDMGGEEAVDFGGMEEDQSSYPVLEVTETPIMGEEEEGREHVGRLTGSDAREDIEEAAEDVGYDSPGWRVPMRSLDIHYFDGEEWVEEWDSIEMGRLPWSVRFRMNFVQPEGSEPESDWDFSLEDDPDYELIVAIPAGVGITQEPPDYVRSGPGGSRDGAGGFGVSDEGQASPGVNRPGASSIRRTPIAGGRKP